jgi:transcriptional regulator with XRE-family HTH domain
MANFEQIGNRIFLLRQSKRWKQESVGRMIGRSGAHISNVENGSAALYPCELEKLAAAFKVSPLFLIADIPAEVSEVVEILGKMEPAKRTMAVKLFRLNLEMMEITKNWPTDEVTPNLALKGKATYSS